MSIECLKIEKNGFLTIGSIFEVGGPMAITELVRRCQDAGCTLHFENENMTVDSTYNDNTDMRAKVMLYTLLAGHPGAAMDYIRYCVNCVSNKNPDAE